MDGTVVTNILCILLFIILIIISILILKKLGEINVVVQQSNQEISHSHNPNGKNVCPISGKRFDDSEAIIANANGKTIKVCSKSCKSKVESISYTMNN
jgi:hypothetical protein